MIGRFVDRKVGLDSEVASALPGLILRLQLSSGHGDGHDEQGIQQSLVFRFEAIPVRCDAAIVGG
ncbi:hypothetical protein CKO51_20580 [Rhodopirellula sp. SM50]|nr:hypothetical protein CKO51_20580 [Rhodopirellula sp. SM50]